MTRKCLNCESDLTSEHGNARYCSRDCRNAARNRKQSISAQRLHALQADLDQAREETREVRGSLDEWRLDHGSLKDALKLAREENERLTTDLSRVKGRWNDPDVKGLQDSLRATRLRATNAAQERDNLASENLKTQARLSKLEEAGNEIDAALLEWKQLPRHGRLRAALSAWRRLTEHDAAAWREERDG